MTTTLRPARHRSGHWTEVGWVLAVAAALAVVGVIGAQFLEPPPTVRELKVTNHADFDVQLFVTTDADDLTLRLPTIPAGEERVIEEVLDSGEQWTFHARSGDSDVAPWVVDREELRDAGWQLEIPEDALDHLRATGATPTPP